MSPGGDFILLNLPSENGKLCELVLTFDEASSLAMTLPKLLTIALHRKFSDNTLRHVYALHGYTVECTSDFRNVMIALAADDGFEVAFACNGRSASSLARDLVGKAKLLTKPEPILRN